MENKWFENLFQFYKITAPGLFVANIGVGIIGLCMGLWSSAVFSFFCAAAMYLAYNGFRNNENK